MHFGADRPLKNKGLLVEDINHIAHFPIDASFLHGKSKIIAPVSNVNTAWHMLAITKVLDILKKQPLDEKFSQGQVQNIGSNSLFSEIYSAISFHANKYCQGSSKRKPFRVPFLLLETVQNSSRRDRQHIASAAVMRKNVTMFLVAQK